MRGEQRQKIALFRPRRGSSPRARGTVDVRLVNGDEHRFIPACAGNSSRPPSYSLRRSVHPRVRGEQKGSSGLGMNCSGSSPRARGTGPRGAEADRRHRFIPACAGNSWARRVSMVSAAVHPRVRGEQARHLVECYIAAGSSPRARGTEGRAMKKISLWRFIPACAGNRASLWSDL